LSCSRAGLESLALAMIFGCFESAAKTEAGIKTAQQSARHAGNSNRRRIMSLSSRRVRQRSKERLAYRQSLAELDLSIKAFHEDHGYGCSGAGVRRALFDLPGNRQRLVLDL
jgi:hypothetical protein